MPGLACDRVMKIHPQSSSKAITSHITQERRMSYKKKSKKEKSQLVVQQRWNEKRSNEAPTCSVDCHNFAEGACAQFVLCQHTELVLRPRLQSRHHQPGLSTRNWHRVPVVWTEVSSLWPKKDKKLKRKEFKTDLVVKHRCNFFHYFPPWET